MKDAARRQMRLQSRSINIVWKMIASIDFTLDGAVLVASFFVEKMNNQVLADNFDLKSLLQTAY